jgi:methylenetetrahydrofolate reductase (NADPH)
MRIDELLANADEPCFSFEFFPPKTEDGVTNLFATIESLRELEPAYVSMTYGAGGTTREGTIDYSTRIKNESGLETMMHLSCVGETQDGLERILSTIESAGIENVLALRGDPPVGDTEFVRPDGGLSSATELAGFISERFPSFALGGSCFPEVHPEAPSLEADLAYLKTKVDAGASFLITQLFFDNQVFFDWQAEARRAGIDVPIIPGIVPILSLAQAQRFCANCDAILPEPIVRQLSALDGDEEAEREFGIAYATRQCEELLAAGAPGIHFYTVNRAPATRAVLGALRVAKPWERAERAPAPISR